MPNSYLTQYQVHTEPVVADKETVTESRWHQPWSEPVRQKIAPSLAIALIASGFVLVQFAFQENVTQDKWYQELSQPVRVKPGLPSGLQQFYAAEPFSQTQPETVTESRWHAPWSEPVRVKPGLLAGLQQFSTQDTISFSTQGVTTWYVPLSEPVKLPQGKPGFQAHLQQFFTNDTIPIAQSRIASTWYAPLSEPVRIKPGLRAELQQVFTQDPVPWNPKYALPWYAVLSEPVRLPPQVRAGAQQLLAYSESAQFPESVTEDRWHVPWSEPVRIKPGLLVTLQRDLTMPVLPVIYHSAPWYAPLSEPVRIKPGLKVSLQLTYANDTILIPNPSVGIQGWYRWLNEPVRAKVGLYARHHPFLSYQPPNFNFGVLGATETKDVFAGTIYSATSLSGAIVSIVEITPIYARTSTEYVTTVFANVGIIEVSS